jgi:hypothetical protein
MAITVKHLKTSAIPDAGDATLVQPSDWNADHTLTGTVPVANGGTGASTANDGFNALAPSQTGNSGKYLTTNGTDSSWSVNPLGTVTSVAATAGTGISVSGSPITTSGTLTITNTAPDQTVSIANGTGISATGTYPAFTVTNTAPDQVVALTAGTGISTTGTYPNFTITNTSPSLGGDVVGPASATDNAIARFDTTTGKLLQNSVVTVGDTGAVSGVTTLSASTSVTTPIVQATNSAGLALKNSAGTTQMSMGAGGGDNLAINVATNINGANAQIDISPTGTGHVHIKPSGTGSIEINPTSAGTIDNMTLGATTPKNASVVDLSVTGTLSFDATQGTSGQVLTSAGTGATPTWTTPTTGTVTSVTGTAPVVSSGGNTPAISMPAATTSVNGYLTSTDWTTFNGKAPAVTYTTNYVPYGQGTTTPALSSNLTFDGNNLVVSGSSAGPKVNISSDALGTALQLSDNTNYGASFIGISGGVKLQMNGTQVFAINQASTGEILRVNTSGKLSTTNDASISGLTVGKGGGAVASNTAVGYQAINASATGTNNTAVGYQAANANTSGYGVSALGQGALKSNTTGAQSTSVGANSLTAATTADNNTALGFNAGFKTTTGSSNVMIGLNAMYENTTGGSNTAIGQQSLNNNTTASNNTAVGYQAGYSNTTGVGLNAFGQGALYNNTTGYGNCAFGASALAANTTGINNLALGGTNAVDSGPALNGNTTGSNNVAVGNAALVNNTTGGSNVAVGKNALSSNSTASNNTAVGYQSGAGITTGATNLCLGYQAANNATVLTTGSQNILIGYQANPSAVGVDYEITMTTRGGSGKGSATGYIDPQGGGVYQGNNSATWSITSDARLKKNIVDNTTGLNAISQIQVRNFEYRTKDEITDLPQQNAIEITGVQLGAIAQEIQAILPECVKTESTGVMSVDTTNLTWYLINAVKELNAKVIALENK